MRRMLALLLTLALAALPLIVHAQPGPFFPAPIGPGGILVNSNASVSAANSASEISMFQYVLTPSLFATGSAVGGVGTPIYTGSTSTGFSGSPLFVTPAPMHFRAVGYVTGAVGTTFNIAANVGSASISLNNQNLVNSFLSPNGVPYTLDIWLSPLATTTATPNGSNSGAANFYMSARAVLGSLATTTASQTLTVISASPTAFNVYARWAAASTTSTLTFLNRVLVIGQ